MSKEHKERSIRLYLPAHYKLLSLLSVYPVLFWLLNLFFFPSRTMNTGLTYGYLLLGSSLFLLGVALLYSFTVRVVLARKRFYWRSNRDYRLHYCRYSEIRQLRIAGDAKSPRDTAKNIVDNSTKGNARSISRQPIYDFLLLFRNDKPETLSLDFANSQRLIRAFMRKNVPVAPSLLHYFLYSQNLESEWLQRYWGKSKATKVAETLRRRLQKTLAQRDQKWQLLLRWAHNKLRREEARQEKEFLESSTSQQHSSEMDIYDKH